MPLSRKEIFELIQKAGVGPSYQSDAVKISSYPLAEKVVNAISAKQLPWDRGILMICPDYNADDALHIVTRFFAYPMRRTAYITSVRAFYDFLRGSETPRIMKPDDEQAFLYGKYVFLTGFCLDDRNDFPYGQSMREEFEDFIMSARRKEGRIFNFMSDVPLAKMNMFSPRFKMFLQDHYQEFSKDTPALILEA